MFLLQSPHRLPVRRFFHHRSPQRYKVHDGRPLFVRGQSAKCLCLFIYLVTFVWELNGYFHVSPARKNVPCSCIITFAQGFSKRVNIRAAS